MRLTAPLLLALLVGCGASALAAPGDPSPPPVDPSRQQEPAPRPAFVLHVVDVGTGLAVLVQGEDFSLVYDAGSNDDLGTGDRNRFVAYLHAALPDLASISHVVLSHPHRDHVELLPDVLLEYQVGDVWDAGVINPICGYRRFIEAIATSPGIRYHSAANGPGQHELDFGKVTCGKPGLAQTVTVDHAASVVENTPIPLGDRASMTFLHVDGRRHGEDFNESTLVARVDLDGTSVLLMGDAEAGGRDSPSKPPTPGSVEGYVLGRYAAQLRADVLIAGHHGSRSSSRASFLAAVAPKVGIISAGPAKYQSITLPDADVVDELEHACTLLRTDLTDATCGDSDDKIGEDADHRPGGCDNIQIHIQGGHVQSDYATLTD